MTKPITLLFAVSCLTACGGSETEENTTDTAAVVTQPASDTGWIALFDGETTSGWHTYGQAAAGAAWIADSGTLYLNADKKEELNGKGGGDILTNDVYDNFHLKMEWKISLAGNSGILLYVQEDTAKYKYTFWTGPEMQVLDDVRHDDRKTPTHLAGSLYDLIQATPGAVKPAGEWNQVEVISNNGKLDFFLNGVNVVNTTMWDDHWK